MRNDCIPLRLRKKLGKTLGTPSPGIAFEVKLFESIFEGKTGNHLDNKLYYYGAHEPATLRLIRSILKSQQNPVYLDVGTNIGQHLMAAAPCASAAFGFEPWDRVRNLAQKALDRNNLNNARIFPFGLGEKDADLPFLPPPENNLGNGLFEKEGQDTDETITLQVRRGDDVIQSNAICPTLIKIDTEGFEAQVLRGLKQTLQKYRPAVIFELGRRSRRDFPTLESMQAFFPEGYSIHGILASREKPRVVPYNEHRKFENLLAWPADTFKL